VRVLVLVRMMCMMMVMCMIGMWLQKKVINEDAACRTMFAQHTIIGG
jgi:hypothetical protein